MSGMIVTFGRIKVRYSPVKIEGDFDPKEAGGLLKKLHIALSSATNKKSTDYADLAGKFEDLRGLVTNLPNIANISSSFEGLGDFLGITTDDARLIWNFDPNPPATETPVS